MAYRAEIEIGVVGIRLLEQLRSEINKSAEAAESLDRVVGQRGSLVQSIENYSNNLSKINSALRLVTAGTQAETKAIQEKATALLELNAIEKRQALLVDEQIKKQVEAARIQKLTAAGIFETTRFKQPIGPELSPLQGQTSPVAERISRTIAQRNEEIVLQEALLRLEQKSAQELNVQLEERKQVARIAAEEVNAVKAKIKGLTEVNELTNKEVTLTENVNKARAGSSRLGGALSSGLIGGGFPLLFGQGPAAAIGGGLGGLAGGLVGGGFGFALSIVGTALGDAAEKSNKFNAELAKLNAETVKVGSSAKITSADVDNLATSFGITQDEALKTLQVFSGFNDARLTKSLAFIYGTDVSTFQGLAAVKDQASLAQVIFNTYDKIGIEKANQLITQLKLGDSAAVELSFQQALLDAKRKQTEEALKQVTIQDRILAAFGTIGSFISGEEQVVNPSIFGKERVQQFRANNPSNKILSDVQNALKQLRSLSKNVQSFSPDKTAEREAEKTAKAAEREASRVANIVRDRAVETEQLKLQQQYAYSIFVAEVDKNNVLKIQLQYAQKYGEISLDYSKQINDEIAKGNSGAVKAAITQTYLTKLKTEQLNESIALKQEEFKQQENYQNMLLNLQEELDLRSAATEEARQQIRLQYELERLKRGGEFTATQLAEISMRKKQINAPKTPAELIAGQIGTIQEGINNLVNAGNQAITIASGIGDAFGTSFKGIIDGSQTAQQALAGFFQSVANSFLDMAAKIIAEWIKMTILNSILSIFPGFGNAGKGLSNLNAPASINNPLGNLGSIGGSYRAAGGPVSANTPYIVGEKGPELFMPRNSGTIIPNNAIGGGSTNVVVNVDASGSKVQGDQPQAKQLGLAVSAAVQAELVKQQRPGGLLYSR